MPVISAGMPVLNAEGTISRAIEDILSQTFGDFELVVCDNASDDRTVDIVKHYARNDDRIRLVQFDERVDILHSFKRAYDNSMAPFFFYAPADDRWYPQFMEKTLAVLQADQTLAACTGRVAFFLDDRFSHITNGTASLLGTPAENIVQNLRDPVENARAFSLFRREALKNVFPSKEYPGWDFQMTTRALKAGGIFELYDVLAERDDTSVEGYIAQAENLISNPVARLVPLHRVAIEVLKDKSLRPCPGLKRALLRLMFLSHMNYSKCRNPRWHRFLLSVLKMLDISETNEILLAVDDRRDT